MVTITLNNGTQVSVASNEDAIAILNGMAISKKVKDGAATTTKKATKKVTAEETNKQMELALGIVSSASQDDPQKRGFFLDQLLALTAPVMVETTGLVQEGAKQRWMKQYLETKITDIRVKGKSTVSKGIINKHQAVVERMPQYAKDALILARNRMYAKGAATYHNPEKAADDFTTICANHIAAHKASIIA